MPKLYLNVGSAYYIVKEFEKELWVFNFNKKKTQIDSIQTKLLS